MPDDNKLFEIITEGKVVYIKRELFGEFLRELRELRFGKPVENKKLDKGGKK